ncbi:protein S100-A16-like, partial [Arapaima gigas]
VSRMEEAIKTIAEVYLKAAKGKENLGAKDFQKLVKKKLHNIMTDTDSAAAVAEMRQGLDNNQDGKVSFQEYMALVSYLATSLNEHITSTMGAQPMDEKKEEEKKEQEEVEA